MVARVQGAAVNSLRMNVPGDTNLGGKTFSSLARFEQQVGKNGVVSLAPGDSVKILVGPMAMGGATPSLTGLNKNSDFTVTRSSKYITIMAKPEAKPGKTDNVKFDHGAPVVLDPPPSVKFPFKLEVAGPKASTGVVVTEAAKGKTIKVKEGQDLTLALPGNPTTGYQWKVISTDRTFGYPTEKFSPGGPGVGSGGTSQFVWKTKNGPLSMVGKHQVTLEYARPFGARTPDTKTFSFTVDVVK